MAEDGSIRASAQSGSELPNDGSNPNPFRLFDSEFGNPYHATSAGFRGQANGADLISPFGKGSLPQFTSLLFPGLTEPQTMWPGLQSFIGESEAKPDTSLPGLHHFKPPVDNPPGFRLADDSSVRNDSPDSPNLWSLGHDPHAGGTLPTGISSDALRPIRDGSDPFDVLGQQRANADPAPSFDDRSLPPHTTSLLFPRMTEPRFHVEPSTNESSMSPIPGDDPVGDDLSGHFDIPSFGYDPVASIVSPTEAGSAGGVPPVAIDPATYLFSDPAGLTAPPRDPVQEALNQIKQIYRIDWQGSDGLRTAFHGDRSADRPTPTVGDAFDPRYVVPTQGGGTCPPPGAGHNNGPPLRDSSPRMPAHPSRVAPNQANPSPTQLPDSSATAAGAAAGAAKTEQLKEAAAPDSEAPEKLEAWQKIVNVRGEEAPEGQYLGPGGRNTSAGVRLNPKLPEPAAGWGYRPAWTHLRDGYRGELQLANRIVSALPNEIVIHYGMPAGRQGPDVISISPSGMISVWDSKWRSGQRSIGPSQRAHQSDDSLNSLYWEILRHIQTAGRSGHLPSDVYALAMKNITARNFDIFTIGTGNAHSGVAQSVRSGVRTDSRRP